MSEQLRLERDSIKDDPRYGRPAETHSRYNYCGARRSSKREANEN